MRILEEVGIEFLDKEVLECWQHAGAAVDIERMRVRMDRDLILEAIAKAPHTFTLHARNPAHTIEIGGDHINFASVAGAPYYSDLEGGRQPGSMEAFDRMIRLSQMCRPLHIIEGLLLEPQDIPIPQRHLAKGFSVLTQSDKAYFGASHGWEIANDYIEMAALVMGGRDAIRERPALACVVNVNSPLRYDDRMLGGLMTYARAGQPAVVTPFILAGAMSPITLASALAQQNAEALAGIALTQLVSPGCPVVYGGFATSIDMRSGSPAFGNPEGALALLAGAQLARKYNLPYRGSGGLNNSKTPDAQAAYETQMTLWPAVLGHANIIIHSAGWLEAGLVCSLEKFILDIEGLGMMHRFLEGITVDPDTLALGSIAEVGPGGHHFGTRHTLDRYQNAFYEPIISDRQNHENWVDKGSQDAMQRAHQVAKTLLRAYERPTLEPGIQEALSEYVERRKRVSTVKYS